MSEHKEKVKFLLSADAYCHGSGYHVVAMGLRNSGFEVVLGGVQMPEEVVKTAIDEDVDCIGYRVTAGEPTIIVPEIMRLLKEKDLHIPVVVGGIVTDPQAQKLKGIGVKGVFPPGSLMGDIVRSIHDIIEKSKEQGVVK